MDGWTLFLNSKTQTEKRHDVLEKRPRIEYDFFYLNSETGMEGKMLLLNKKTLNRTPQGVLNKRATCSFWILKNETATWQVKPGISQYQQTKMKVMTPRPTWRRSGWRWGGELSGSTPGPAAAPRSPGRPQTPPARHALQSSHLIIKGTVTPELC